MVETSTAIQPALIADSARATVMGQTTSTMMTLVETSSEMNGKLSSPCNSSGSMCSQADLVGLELGNKCGKCQNHEVEVNKRGHARECPFKKCDCLKCRLLDARSDILQVISGKETKLKGTKKDPNCGFCQNHGVKILRKGHVRSCGFGQERHFRLDNCFDCEVHYIRNEVNRLQIKMRRAMKEDRTLSEEQRKTAREAITRDEVEKVCDMARVARRKRENILSRQPVSTTTSNHDGGDDDDDGPETTSAMTTTHSQIIQQQHQLNQQLIEAVWRPWSQHQVAAAIVAQQQQQQQQQQQHLKDESSTAALAIKTDVDCYVDSMHASAATAPAFNGNLQTSSMFSHHGGGGAVLSQQHLQQTTRSPSPSFGSQMIGAQFADAEHHHHHYRQQQLQHNLHHNHHRPQQQQRRDHQNRQQQSVWTLNGANQFSPNNGQHHPNNNNNSQLLINPASPANQLEAITSAIAPTTTTTTTQTQLINGNGNGSSGITAQEQQLFNTLQFFQLIVAQFASQSNARTTIE